MLSFLFRTGSALCLAAGLAGAGAIYDLAGDWSDANNPNGPWAYRSAGDLLPSIADFVPFFMPDGQRAWALDALGGNSGLPAWLKLIGNTDNGQFQTGEVLVHPYFNAQTGDESRVANLLWISPAAGWIDVTGGIWIGAFPRRGNQWSLYLNGNLLGAGVVDQDNPFSRAAPMPIAAAGLAVAAGDELRLDLRKAPGWEMPYFSALNLTVEFEPVPEPGGVWLTGLGIAWLAFTLRRR